MVYLWSQQNFRSTMHTIVEYSLLPFLAIGQVLRNLWHFDMLRWDSTKTLDIMVSGPVYVGYISCLILWVKVGVIHALCTISDIKISKNYCAHSLENMVFGADRDYFWFGNFKRYSRGAYSVFVSLVTIRSISLGFSAFVKRVDYWIITPTETCQ